MTLDDFVNQYTGQAVSYDSVAADNGQCVQLVCLYWQKVLGYNCPLVPAAKDLWDNPDVLAHFDRIPPGQEQKGDVAVWGASSLINSPQYGHTDIVLSHGFLGFDSNWGGVKAANGYPAAHQVQHNYTDVLGFLRKKGNNMYPNKGDLVNFHNATGWLGHAPNDNDVAYWCSGTNNPAWAEGADAVWKALLYDVTTYVLNHPPTAQPINKTAVVDYINNHLS